MGAKKKRKEKRRQKYLTSKIPVVLSKNTNHKNLGTLSDVCFSWADVNVSRFCNDLYSRRQELLYFWGYNQPLQILFDEFLFLCYSRALGKRCLNVAERSEGNYPC